MIVSAFQAILTMQLCALGKACPSQILGLFSIMVMIAPYFPCLAHRIMVWLEAITAII